MNNEHTETEYTENDVQKALNVLESLDFSEKMVMIALLVTASIFGEDKTESDQRTAWAKALKAMPAWQNNPPSDAKCLHTPE